MLPRQRAVNNPAIIEFLLNIYFRVCAEYGLVWKSIIYYLLLAYNVTRYYITFDPNYHLKRFRCTFPLLWHNTIWKTFSNILKNLLSSQLLLKRPASWNWKKGIIGFFVFFKKVFRNSWLFSSYLMDRTRSSLKGPFRERRKDAYTYYVYLDFILKIVVNICF